MANNPVEGAVRIARALKAAGFTPPQIAPALVGPEVYPMLTALQLGVVLLDPTVFPQLTADELGQALAAAGKYSQSEIDSAVNQLFTKPRTLGPVGGGSLYYGPPENFDDLQFALGAGKPIVGINLRTGDLVDSIQAVYQGGILGPPHGGDGGSPQSVDFDAGDWLAKVSGKFGMKWGSIYILQIVFTTKSGKAYGPYPNWTAQGDDFSFAAAPSEQIIAFFGQVALAQRYDAPPSKMVVQLGVYTKTY